MSAHENRDEVVKTLIAMVAEVLGGDDFGIDATSSFRDGLGFQSIQFIALAELIQERWVDLDFVTWLAGKQLEEIYALEVGDVADFIVASSLA